MRFIVFLVLLATAALCASDEREAEWLRLSGGQPLAVRVEQDDLDKYHTPAQSASLIRSVVAGGVVPSAVVALGNSGLGREILGVRMAQCAGGRCDDRPTVVYFGPVHGDERVGGELLYRLVAHIRDYWATKTVQDLLSACNLVVVPHPNPDGFHALRRELENGVDMNRAFYPDRCGTPNPFAHLGAVPEVEHAKAFFLSENPEAALLMHGGAVVVSYPYDDECTHHGSRIPSLAPDATLHFQMARNYSMANYLMSIPGAVFRDGVTNGAQWYSLSGGLQDWTLLNVPRMLVPLTVELSNVKLPPFDEIGRRHWGANFHALTGWPAALRQGVWGTVAQDDGLSPEGASVFVIAATGSRAEAERDGKAVPVRADGRYFRPMGTGNWQVCVTKPGYNSACSDVAVRRGETVRLHTQMHK